MTSGNVSTGPNTLILQNSDFTSLSYTSGVIIGKFERFIDQTSQNYFFPVGIAGQIHSLTCNFSDLTNGSLLVEYFSGDPGNSGLPLTDDDGTRIVNQYTTGYWSALAGNSLASTNYNIDLDATGFGPYSIIPETRLISRTDAGGSWNLDGNHSDAVGSVVKRTGMSGIFDSGGGTNFGLGRSGPRITSQPADQAVCENGTASFSVTATGHPALGYKWYKDGIQINDGIKYSGTNTNILDINNLISGDGGSYYCVVTDGHGSTVQSNSALLTVNPLPIGISSPTTQTLCSDQAITAIVLSTSNSLSGTTYSWTRDKLVEVTGLAASGTTDITGTPNNVTGVDQTVTYTITPTSGAGCVGNAFTATVIVRSEPVGVSTPATQTVCSDEAITTDSSYYQ